MDISQAPVIFFSSEIIYLCWFEIYVTFFALIGVSGVASFSSITEPLRLNRGCKFAMHVP